MTLKLGYKNTSMGEWIAASRSLMIAISSLMSLINPTVLSSYSYQLIQKTQKNASKSLETNFIRGSTLLEALPPLKSRNVWIRVRLLNAFLSPDLLPDALLLSSFRDGSQPTAIPLCENGIFQDTLIIYSFRSLHLPMSSISEYAKAPVLSTILFSYSSHVSLTDEDFMLAWESPFAGWRRERRFMSKKSCEAAESTEGAFCEWRGCEQ